MTEKIKKAIKEVLWDYNITEDEFIKMLDSEIKPGGFDRLWAERRAIEGMGYYDLIEIVGLKRIARDWDMLKATLRNKTRVQGIEYVIRKYNIPAAG
ncbi:MAG TPA: hypothetical protein PLB12_03550 [Candidatus Goldiibacteriota bacterium]|jgi:hypothetical protein|nr:hypothetical protein [Candidatus Goldiibacteriota bacterium]HPN65307.1 hypothetical protein [Candidatus Goldiibacteriota bacterium]HRQ43405.1 hypothetical protein [Candidatus Goldiibacteriota bacterium]